MMRITFIEKTVLRGVSYLPYIAAWLPRSLHGQWTVLLTIECLRFARVFRTVLLDNGRIYFEACRVCC